MSAPSPIVTLYAARAARGFGDGFAAIILPAYLIEIGFNPFQVGLVATAALLGSAATTLTIGFVAPRYDLRTLLIACAALMVLTGIAIPSGQHLLFIAAIAFIGTMNPTTGDIGVHVPLEQAALAHRAADRERTHIFARYSLIGALSIAAGALAAGAPDLREREIAAISTLVFDSCRSRCPSDLSKSAQVQLPKNAKISSDYKFRTKTAKYTALEKNALRERISDLRARLTVQRFDD